MIDQRFGRLVVVRSAGPSSNGHLWLCRCDCNGAELIVIGHSLRTGNTQSCGCLRKERAKKANTKHGHSGHAIYGNWHSMLQRCENPKHRFFARYGGRGITVCERWHSLEAFLEDMGTPPSGHSIDRIDNDLGYFPENCRWAPAKKQANNRRNNRLVTINGTTQTVSEWANRSGIKVSTIFERLRRNWPPEKLLSKPTH